MSTVRVNTYTYSVNYVSGQMMASLKTIVQAVGLSPAKLVGEWAVIEAGLKVWLDTRHLEALVLEVFDPTTDALLFRWDFTLDYGYGEGDGSMWLDTEVARNALRKAGAFPATCGYRVVATNKPGYPAVDGWSSTSLRSTDGFVRQSVGTAVGAPDLAAAASYWRKAS